MSENLFELGDIVEAWGCKGTVTEIVNHRSHPVTVKFFDAPEECWFLLDGREDYWHKTPVLKLLKRQEPTEPVKHWPALVRYEKDILRYRQTSTLYADNRDPKEIYGDRFVRLLKELPPVMILKPFP